MKKLIMTLAMATGVIFSVQAGQEYGGKSMRVCPSNGPAYIKCIGTEGGCMKTCIMDNGDTGTYIVVTVYADGDVNTISAELKCSNVRSSIDMDGNAIVYYTELP